MPARSKWVPVPNSERRVVAGAQPTGPVDPAEMVTVTVYVRPNPATAPALRADLSTDPGDAPAPLSAAEFNAAYGASPDDLAQVADYATRSGLEVVESSAAKRSVQLQGPASAVEAAFGVKLQYFEFPQERYRGRVGEVMIPRELADVVEFVFGLDDRRVGASRLRRDGRADLDPFALRAVPLSIVRNTGLPPNCYLPPTVAEFYQFPPGTDGNGQCVAIVAFNDPQSHGGYNQAALETYFTQVLNLPMPEIVDVVVHGQGNDPGDDSGRDPADTSGEVMLDIQMVGGCAPKAKLVLYFTQFTEQGWVDAINAIITDEVNNPSVISISYGNPEDDPRSAWTAMAIRKVNEAFRAAAARGITICCASGDDGSRDQGLGPRAHADFPASSPYVLGCGGTRVYASGGVVLHEVVWNNGPGSASGGGVSAFFPVPRWQQNAGVPPSANPGHQTGRGVPDVGGIADPQTGVVIITLDGQSLAVVGGTSATAPMWAALVSRLNQALQTRLGFIDPALYGPMAPYVTRDIILGNNGAYAAGIGWDACTGARIPSRNSPALRLRPPPGQPRPPATASSRSAIGRADAFRGRLALPRRGAARGLDKCRGRHGPGHRSGNREGAVRRAGLERLRPVSRRRAGRMERAGCECSDTCPVARHRRQSHPLCLAGLVVHPSVEVVK